MILSEISKYRLASQQVNGTRFRTGKQMLAWFGAVQGQEYAQSKWALGLRMPFLTDRDLEKEFTDGSILRTHLLRPTWHFVAPEDIRWLLLLTAPRVDQVNGHMYRKLDLDEKVFHRCNDILIKTLQGGKQLTRNELNEEFKKQNIIAESHRLSYIMMRAELDGVVCSGARRARQFTYALLEERVPPAPAINRQEALAELTKRYFASRGPATTKDFSTWSGLTLADCRTGIEMVRDDLIREQINGDDFFFTDLIFAVEGQDKDEGEGKVEKKSDTMHLLPAYDELLMGYKQSRDVLFEHKKSISPDPAMTFDNTILYRDQIIGTWKRTIKNSSIEVQYNFFKSLNKKEFSLFEEAVLRYKEFKGLEVRFTRSVS